MLAITMTQTLISRFRINCQFIDQSNMVKKLSPEGTSTQIIDIIKTLEFDIGDIIVQLRNLDISGERKFGPVARDVSCGQVHNPKTPKGAALQ